MSQAVQKHLIMQKKEIFVVCGVISLFSFLIFCWANFRSAIGIARNDDWVYLHMAKWFADSGQFQVESGSMANAMGLVILGQPSINLFGYSIAHLQVFEIFLGAIGLVATWLLLRSFLNIWLSFIAIGTLVVSPFWISTSVSFMTDVPAYTFQTIALLFAVRAYRAQRMNTLWLFAAYFFSFAAFSVREYSIASGLAITGFFIFSKSQLVKKIRKRAFAFASLWLFACIALFFWRSNLENAAEFRGLIEFGALKESAIQALRAICMVGFLLIPSLLQASPIGKLKRLNLQRNLLAFVPSVIFVFVMFVLFRKRSLIFGNYFTPQGSYTETFPIGIAPNIIPAPLFDLLTWFGVAALAYLLWLLSLGVLSRSNEMAPHSSTSESNTSNEQVWLISWYAFGMLGILTFVPLITNAPLFDRYFLPVIPFFAALVLHFIQKFHFSWAYGKVLSAAALAGLAFVSSIYIDSSFILDGLKWKAGNQLVSDGYEPQTIDAGYEWFGYHQTEVASGRHIQPIRNWWTTLYESPRVCASVAIGVLDAEINEQAISHRFEVLNFVGTEFLVRSIATQPTCLK